MIGSDSLGGNAIGTFAASGVAGSTVIINRDKLPYRQQPPSGIPARRDGIGRSLVYASPIAYETVEHVAGGGGWGKFTIANTNAPTYSKTSGLGKTVLFDETNNTPIQASGMGGFSLPLTVMVTFNGNTWNGSMPCLLGIGSGGSSGGWRVGIDATVMTFTLGSVANYALTLSGTLNLGTNYVLVVTVTGDGGNVQAWVRNLDSASSAIITTTPTAVGTMNTTFQNPLTLGAGNSAGTFVDPGGFHIGSFAIWNRAISTAEVYDLLQNPYHLWIVPERGRFTATSSGSVGSASGSASGSGQSASTGTSTGAATGSGQSGSTGSSNGVASGSGQSGSKGVATGSATVNGVALSGSTGTATGSSTGSAQSASKGVATGSASGAGQTGSIGAATGAATGSAVGRKTYQALGTAAGVATGNAISKNRIGVGGAVGSGTGHGLGYGFKIFRVLTVDAANRTILVDAIPARVIYIDQVPVRVVYFEYD